MAQQTVYQYQFLVFTTRAVETDGGSRLRFTASVIDGKSDEVRTIQTNDFRSLGGFAKANIIADVRHRLGARGWRSTSAPHLSGKFSPPGTIVYDLEKVVQVDN